MSPSGRPARRPIETLGTDTVFVNVRMPEEYRGELTAPPGYNEVA